MNKCNTHARFELNIPFHFLHIALHLGIHAHITEQNVLCFPTLIRIF